MSVFLSNVDDFVNPSQACVNPVFNGTAASTTSQQRRGEGGAVAIAGVRTRGPGQKKRTAASTTTTTTDQVVTATIADCLACSGCVTTAETVLMEERHNLEKLSSALASKRPVLLTISPAALADWQRHHDHGAGDGIGTASTAQWVSLWHKYLNVVAVIDGNLPLQWSLAAAVREFTDAYRRNQRLLATAEEKNGTDLDMNVSKNEMFEQKMLPSRALDRNKTEYWLADGTTEVVDEAPRPRAHQALPLITSSCPAIVCYVEKSSHALVPHLSTAASPMMCFGTFALDDVFHVAIQPCHDKKLEANRLDFTGSSLDLVLTTGELLDFMSSKFPEVHDWNAAASNLVSAESRPIKDPRELMSVLSSWIIDCGRPLYCLPSIGLERSHLGSEPHVFGSGGYADTVFRRAAQDLFGIEICPVWEPVASTTRRGRNGRGSKRDFYSASLYQSAEDGSYTTTTPSSSSSNATLVWKFGIAYGLQTVQRIFADIGSYQYVEAMACAGSCLNGAGQLRLGNPETPDETRERLAASRRLFSTASESLDLSIAGAHTRFHMVPAMRHSMGVAAGVAVEDTRCIMDLLDYGSSDDDDDGEGQRKQEPPQRSKVLKLASILPQHILDRLTKGGTGNKQGNDDEDSSSDDGSAGISKTRKRKEKTAETTRVSSLLSDLADIKPKNSSLLFQRSPFDLGGGITAIEDATPREEEAARTGAPSNLGEAFLRPKITIESKRKSNGVRDIHAESSEPDEPAVPAESAEPMRSKDESHFVGAKMKRPVIQAAPPVRSSNGPVSALPTMATTTEASWPATTALKSAPHITAKKSRQQLERELRSGNVGAVEGIAVDGVIPTDHAPTVIDYDAMTTIRNIPSTMYDPGSGQMKQAKVSKAKNQIHFLVHQAAELERRRAEQGPARPSHRADAKRKYGF